MSKPTPTDLEILEEIYEKYYDAYSSYNEAAPSRDSKLYVPIDIQTLAASLNVDSDIIFGRLYYHLEKKYGYRQSDGGEVQFFAMQIGRNRHCIHFPYLASVLAGLRQENRKYRIALTMSIISLCISVISFAISIYPKL